MFKFKLIFGLLTILMIAPIIAQPIEDQSKDEQGRNLREADSKKDDQAQTDKPSVEEKILILEEEIQKLKLQQATKKYQSQDGLGPAASNVYGAADGLSLGGYGEIYGNAYQSRFRPGVGDVARLVLYAGYHFNDWIIFNSELEYEHAGFERKQVVTGVNFGAQTTTTDTVASSETIVEFAYFDFLFRKYFNIRAGLNLVPIGITNYMHEPTTFYSVLRPAAETTIIPSTWRELGFIAHGDLANGKLAYRTGFMTGLDETRLNSGQWLGEDASSQGSQSTLREIAFVLNLDWKPAEDALIGGTYYLGRAGQGNVPRVSDQSRFAYPPLTALCPVCNTSDSLGVNAEVTGDLTTLQTNRVAKAPVLVHIAEAHSTLKYGPWEFRALVVRGWMNQDDTRSVNGSTGQNVGKIAEGGYLEAAFNVLSSRPGEKLMVFLRDEHVNTQRHTVTRPVGGKDDILDFLCSQGTSCLSTAQMPAGNQSLGYIASARPGKELYGVTGVADRTNDFSIVTLGMAYFPHPNVSLKLEYQWNDSKTNYSGDIASLNPNNNKINQINFGIGFIF